MSEECEARVKAHLAAFLSDGQRVLEISSSSFSSLFPESVALGRKEIFLFNQTSLAGPHFELPFKAAAFDAVHVSAGIEFFNDPQDAFKEIWRVLSPGGRCFVTFLNKLSPAEEMKPLKMWTTMNEEQKIWIVGSYFHYSAGEGWTGIEGYDLFSASSQALIFEKKEESSSAAYIVQASKSDLPSLEESSFNFTMRKLSGVRHLTTDDCKYNVRNLLILSYKTHI